MNPREAIRKLQPGTHVFVMRENEDIFPWVEDGLAKNEFVCCIGSGVAHVEKENQVEFVSFEDFLETECNPERMIASLEAYAIKAEELHFSRLRVVQDMSWINQKVKGWENYRTYEARINELCSIYDMVCVCFYDGTFPADVLLEALKTHPFVIREDVLCRNLYYVSYERLLQDSMVTAYLENVYAFHQMEKTLKEKALEKTQELQTSEMRYRTLIDNVPDVVYSLDSTGHFIEVNPAVTQMLGYSRDELLGEHFAKVLHPDAVGKASQSFGELVKGKRDRTIGLQLDVVTKKGNIKIGELNARAIYDKKGHFLRTEGIVRDITERKRQEEQLKFLAGVVENVMEAVVIADGEGVITYVNPTACSAFGYTKEELQGEVASILISGNSQVIFQEILESVYEGDWEGEVLAITKSGRKFPLWLRTSGLRDEQGEVTAFVTVSRDITEQKAAEEKLQRYALLLEMKVREKTKGTETLLKTSYALRSTSNWKEGMEIITKGIVEGLGFDRAAVFFVNEHEGILECKGQLNISEKFLRVTVSLTDDRYAAVRCVNEKRPVLVKDSSTDSRVKAHLEEAKEFVWVPILFQSEVLGAILADRKRSLNPIETEDVDMLELYANQIAEFIERTRLVVEPEEEKQVSTPLKYDVELREVYLIEEERPEKAYDMFADLVKHGFRGFGICRTHPGKVREKYGLEKTPVMWLSEIERRQVEQVGPQDIPKLVYLVSEFIKRAQPAVVIVEGVEYLVVQNDFRTVLKLLNTLSDYVATSESVLLLPVNPHALPEHQYVMLKRAFRVVSE